MWKHIRSILFFIFIFISITGCIPSQQVTYAVNVTLDVDCGSKDVWFSGIVPVGVNIHNGTGNGVKFFVNDQLALTDETPNKSHYAYEWDTSSLNEGIYKITAVVSTNKGEVQKELNLKVRHYLPSFHVTSDSASATLCKYDGDNENRVDNAFVHVNNLDLLYIHDKDIYQTQSGAFHADPGDNITLKMEHPNMGTVNESIEFPYTAKNLTTSSIARWLSGGDSELTVTWEAPDRFNFDYWELMVLFHDAQGNNFHIWSGRLNLYDRSYKFAHSDIPQNAVYDQVKLISGTNRILGYYVLPSQIRVSDITVEAETVTGNL